MENGGTAKAPWVPKVSRVTVQTTTVTAPPMKGSSALVAPTLAPALQAPNLAQEGGGGAALVLSVPKARAATTGTTTAMAPSTRASNEAVTPVHPAFRNVPGATGAHASAAASAAPERTAPHLMRNPGPTSGVLCPQGPQPMLLTQTSYQSRLGSTQADNSEQQVRAPSILRNADISRVLTWWPAASRRATVWGEPAGQRIRSPSHRALAA